MALKSVQTVRMMSMVWHCLRVIACGCVGAAGASTGAGTGTCDGAEVMLLLDAAADVGLSIDGFDAVDVPDEDVMIWSTRRLVCWIQFLAKVSYYLPVSIIVRILQSPRCELRTSRPTD